MEGLGFDFNVYPVASGVHYDLSNARGITFVCFEEDGATSIVFQQSIDGADKKNLAVINHYYGSDGISSGWTRHTDDSGGDLANEHTVTPSDGNTTDCVVFHIDRSMLDVAGGFNAVECTPNGGECIAILHGLKVQRTPVNLPNPAHTEV
jgi:hypothetical protein